MLRATAIQAGLAALGLMVAFGGSAGGHSGKEIKRADYTFPCTNMPRLGANGVLSQEKISHILAYLLDPASPVNQ